MMTGPTKNNLSGVAKPLNQFDWHCIHWSATDMQLAPLPAHVSGWSLPRNVAHSTALLGAGLSQLHYCSRNSSRRRHIFLDVRAISSRYHTLSLPSHRPLLLPPPPAMPPPTPPPPALLFLPPPPPIAPPMPLIIELIIPEDPIPPSTSIASPSSSSAPPPLFDAALEAPLPRMPSPPPLPFFSSITAFTCFSARASRFPRNVASAFTFSISASRSSSTESHRADQAASSAIIEFTLPGARSRSGATDVTTTVDVEGERVAWRSSE